MSEKGDKFASGTRTGVIPMLNQIKFDEGQMHDDLPKLTLDEFCTKYLITPREYEMLLAAKEVGNEERVSAFAEQMKRAVKAVEQQLAIEAKQEQRLDYECFIQPLHPVGLSGRVIICYDKPKKKLSEKSKLILPPKSQRTERTLLPTTGHIIRAAVWDELRAKWVSDEWIGKRVLFNQTSGSPICFNNFPTWNELELGEILGIVEKEDAEVQEEELLPMI